MTEEPLLRGRQTVDARSQDGLHRAGHMNGGQGVRQPIVASRTRQRARLDQRSYALLEKKRIALGSLDQESLERVQAVVAPDEYLEQQLGTFPLQRVDPELRVVGLAAPAMSILGPIAAEQQQTDPGQALGKAPEYRLRLAVDPPTKGPPFRGPMRWMSRATKQLPVPVSPWMRMAGRRRPVGWPSSS